MSDSTRRVLFGTLNINLKINVHATLQFSDKSNDNIKIGYIRGNKKYYTNIKLYKDNNTYKTGMYVKDNVTGIGTLTYIDPNTKINGKAAALLYSSAFYWDYNIEGKPSNYNTNNEKINVTVEEVSDEM